MGINKNVDGFTGVMFTTSLCTAAPYTVIMTWQMGYSFSNSVKNKSPAIEEQFLEQPITERIIWDEKSRQ